RTIPRILPLVPLLILALSLVLFRLGSLPVVAPHRQAGLGDIPLSFETNVGQTDPFVLFLAHSQDSTAYFTASGVVLSLVRAPSQDAATGESATTTRRPPLRGIDESGEKPAPVPGILRL